MEVKRCTKCGEEKPLELFPLDKRKKIAPYKASCKACHKLAFDLWRSLNKDKVRINSAKTFQKHKESRMQRARAWELANKERHDEKRREADAKRHAKNPQLRRQRMQKEVESLSNSYVRATLRLNKSSAPDSLIDAHRVYILVQRQLKAMK